MKAEIILEAIVLEDGKVFDGLAIETKQVLEKGGCRTILLWKSLAEWYLSSIAGLPVTPGINLVEETFSCRSVYKVHFHILRVL